MRHLKLANELTSPSLGQQAVVRDARNVASGNPQGPKLVLNIPTNVP